MRLESMRYKTELLRYLLKIGANISWVALLDLPPYTSRGNWTHDKNLDYLLMIWSGFANVDMINLKSEHNILKFCESKKTWKIYLKRIAKLQALNVELAPHIIENITEAQDVIKDFFQKCKEELELAKSTKLKNCWVTYFNLLVDSKRNLKNYAGNVDLMEDFESSDCLKKFPIYGPEISKNMEKGIKIRKAFDTSTEVLSHCLPIFIQTHLIIRDTLNCLKFKDYNKLMMQDLSN